MPFLTFVLTLYSICEPVAPPTLCGSPTVMENVGLAACSTVMLGRLDARTGLGCAAATGGGALGPRPKPSSPSSSTRCGSGGLRIELPGAVGMVERTDKTCSLSGGAGGDSSPTAEGRSPAKPGSSPPDTTELLPAEPSGPRGSSSTACKRVGWATSRRGVRREVRPPDEEAVDDGVREAGFVAEPADASPS